MALVKKTKEKIIIGWKEWCYLPELGLNLRAKIDTGAQTSALHAQVLNIEEHPNSDHKIILFKVWPDNKNPHTCSARFLGYRTVTSSTGHREKRALICTLLRLGSLEFPIYITLTNRESMAYRMLLGRQALKRGLLIAPGKSYCLGTNS